MLMEEFGVKPDVITFSTIMNAWSTAGFMEKCKQIFDNMVKAGIKPDIHAYCILAKGYVRAQEPEKAEELLTSMVKSGVRPNVVIFTTIISGWCSSGRMENALQVFDKMWDFGISPNLKTFETLIWGYAEAKQPWRAEELLQVMKVFKVQPEKSTVFLVADAWRAIGLTREANRILSVVKRKEKNTHQKETEEVPLESLEKSYQKRYTASSYPTLLQIPTVVTSDQKGSAAATKNSRLMSRDGDSSMESSLFATKSVNLPHTCKFGERLPIICRKHCQGQLGMYGQFAQSCTVVFFN